ncbi:integral membrane sensor signal transduction histidine kinase [Roseiflexus castenholzii DSM 13941]|jgi:signal transduction histidine kinase|uniref:histidine kinase n=1 Tax=Roseiflexus castenholzii (strain DSM 13941 / HLO8) TaxID=383372 RepID=A7NK59_ROSCS|nr:integral membrane sensor signal transduction histidine kinase [Roseiflexus castenholzii DSM 13941]
MVSPRSSVEAFIVPAILHSSVFFHAGNYPWGMTVERSPTLVDTYLRARLLGMALVNVSLALLLIVLYIGLLTILLWIGIQDQMIAHMLASVGMAVAVIPVRQRLVRFSNWLLRLRWQNSEEILREFSAALSHTIEPDALRALLIADLPQRLRLYSATLWMLEPPEDQMFVAIGQEAHLPGATILAQGASIGKVRRCPDYLRVPVHADDEWARPFVAQGIGLLFPLRIGSRLVGIYGCGWSMSRRGYSRQTISLLVTLAPAIASALENTRAYTEIARLNNQLRRLDKLKDQFIEHVGHELRTPLTSLSLALQLLTHQPELMRDLSHVVRNSILQLEALVNRVLLLDHSFENATAHMHRHSSSIELLPLLEEVAESFMPAVCAKGLDLRVQAPEGLAAWGDVTLLRRALHEVIDNAIRYSDTGTVTITASVRDGLAVITVEDQGPGIPPDERDLLFNAFYRGRRTRALAEQPGVGLGLSLARRDIEALRGQIWLERTGSDGSVMCVALPAVELSYNEVGRSLSG